MPKEIVTFDARPSKGAREYLPDNLRVVQHHWALAQVSFSELLSLFKGNSRSMVDFMDDVAYASDIPEYQSRLAKAVSENPSDKKMLLLLAVVNNLAACAENSEAIKNLMPFAESWKDYINRATFPRKFLETLCAVDATAPSMGIQTGIDSQFTILEKYIKEKQSAWDSELPRSLVDL